MKSVILFFALTTMSSQAFSFDFENSQNCVITYTKDDNSVPNLIIACDGERVLTSTVAKESEMSNPEEFRAALFDSFQSLVNSKGEKVCKDYNYERAWWASCLSK